MTKYFLPLFQYWALAQSTYLEYTTVSVLLSELGPLLPSFPQSSVSPTRNQRGGGHTRLRVRGWGVSIFRRLEKKPSTLWPVVLRNANLPAKIFPICFQVISPSYFHLCKYSIFLIEYLLFSS